MKKSTIYFLLLLPHIYMIQRLIKIANALDELGYTELANEVDALIVEADKNPYGWDPRGDQASEDRSSSLSQARREIRWKLEHAIRDIAKAPYAVFSISLSRKKFGPFDVEFLFPHAKTFNSMEAAAAFYKENEHLGREGYISLMRQKDTLRSAGDRGLLKDILHARPEIVG